MIQTATFRGHAFKVCMGTTHPAYSLAIFSPGGEEHDFREQHWKPEPGQFVVDVGASYGAYALTAAACGAKVLAFEPEPTVAVDLERNVALNPGFDVTVVRMALGNEAAGMVDMRSYAPHWPPQTISGDYPASRLDAFDVPQCDLLKIDVEGLEADVLRGAMATLKRFHPVCIVEVHTFLKPTLLRECELLLQEAGYTAFEYVEREPCVMVIAKELK